MATELAKMDNTFAQVAYAEIINLIPWEAGYGN